ncbi:MAG: tRNA lysidine(34) synthetase TilS [Gammaproteobacteria bacterium]|nr:MAG: tRNA lysidine(34) synthetase TilS [Gammaproteobacteria bacterium]
MLKNVSRVLANTENLKKVNSCFSSDALGRILVDDLGIPPGACLKVAYSGGLDSHVLLHALANLRAQQDWSVEVIHIHHGLNDNADIWAQHCRAVCQELGLALTIERIHVDRSSPHGLEAEARQQRYQRLAASIDEDEVLLTAHHRDDQAETLLLQLMRGAGVKGLTSMPAVSSFSEGKHVRPLLAFSRAELEVYARANRLSWIDDDSNQDEQHARNFIRHRVMPVLKSRWTEIDSVLARTANHMVEAEILLEEVAKRDLLACQNVPRQLQLSALLGLPQAHQPNLIRYWIRSWGYRSPASYHIREILDCARRSACRYAAIRWSDAAVYRYRDRLYLITPLPDADRSLRIDWNLAKPLRIPGTRLRLSAESVFGRGLSRDRVSGSSTSVRFRQGGEVCQLPGRSHHHKLKKLLQEAGIPPWERQRLPLLYVGSELAAIGDRWVCQPYAAKSREAGFRLVLQETQN